MDADDSRSSSSAAAPPPSPPRPTPRRVERDWALRPLAPPERAGTSRLWRLLGAAGGCFLGAVLLVAVWGKAIDPQGFVELLHREGLDRLVPAGGVWGEAIAALTVEAALGMALLLGVRRLWVLVPASLMVALFVGLNGREWWLAAHGQADAGASCGCFGNLVQRTPAQAFWQDLLLLVPALALAFAGRGAAAGGSGWGARRSAGLPLRRTAATALFALAVALFAWWAPALPLDDLATRLKPGVEVRQLCAGDPAAGGACLDTVVPDLAHGDHLVVMGDVDDAAMAKAVPALNAYVGSPRAAAVWLLTASPENRRRTFFWKWGPKFNVVEAPAELLRPLYRRLPRSFAVQDGRVTATFSGLPPLPGRSAGGDPRNPLTRLSP
jgi:hypothetical protein